jgi:excisionase family DNA binding protein
MVQVWKAEEVGEMLGLSTQTLAKWRSEGRGPTYIKVGDRVRYSETDVQAWLDSQRVTP